MMTSRLTRGRFPRLLVFALIAIALAATHVDAATVSLIVDRDMGPAARHGLAKVKEALAAKDFAVEQTTSWSNATGTIRIATGLGKGPSITAGILADLNITAPTKAESLLVRTVKYQRKNVLVITGADDRGLMYALLDVADRIGWATGKNPLRYVDDIEESPAVSERALSMYTMHQGHFESFFYDEDYWRAYLDMLAKNRFNTFALLFGYENWGYFSPPYPYFFDTEGFEHVKVIGITPDKQQQNLKALNRIIEMTHERGMDFTLGIWDHIYRGGVQGPTGRAEKATDGIVWGLTAENLVDYTNVALAEFVERVPDIDAIQFRMHGESGLKRDEMHKFWENVYAVMNRHGKGIRFDARAKNFPDSLIDKAVEMGVDIRICTKYWMEQMGMPFHPTHVHPGNQKDRRHGYADLLSYPQRYRMHWRLWNAGTSRILLWGDPDYVRRFGESTHLYNGDGFEVTEPLGTKMQDHPHDMTPFELLNSEHRYYKWEFQRYWHFFQVFGRVGYNPDTPTDIWDREFNTRFGKAAGPYVARAMHTAGKILPRTVTYNYPYNMFPTTRGWVEKQRMKDLPEYADSLASDTQQFLSMNDAAKCVLQAKDSAKMWPQQSSRWFADISDEVLALAGKAEMAIADKSNKEFASTIVDLKILAYLAEYHSHRAMAGFSYALFKQSGDLNSMDDAIAHEADAIGAWEKLVASAGDFYHDNLMMGRDGAGLSGHWKDELVELRAGLTKLKQQRDEFKPGPDNALLSVIHVPVRRTSPGKALQIRATIASKEPIQAANVVYGNGQLAAMKQTAPMRYTATIGAKAVKPGLQYSIETVDASGKKMKNAEVAVIVSKDSRPPSLEHEYIETAPAERPLRISAKVSDPSGVKLVRLRYRAVNQTRDYETLDMVEKGDTGVYECTVPAEQIEAKWDFMYFFEVTDNAGNGKIYPDLEKEAPYIIVKLTR